LLATIRAAQLVLEAQGVLVVGSEVPNLLEPGVAATLVVSQDLDIGVFVDRHAAVKQRLAGLREFEPSADASHAYAITRQDADLLVAEGHRVEPAGRELEPPKLIVFAPAARVERIASRRSLAVRLSADLMLADCLALVPFHGEGEARLST
jgi:hypothetical protein